MRLRREEKISNSGTATVEIPTMQTKAIRICELNLASSPNTTWCPTKWWVTWCHTSSHLSHTQFLTISVTCTLTTIWTNFTISIRNSISIMEGLYKFSLKINRKSIIIRVQPLQSKSTSLRCSCKIAAAHKAWHRWFSNSNSRNSLLIQQEAIIQL